MAKGIQLDTTKTLPPIIGNSILVLDTTSPSLFVTTCSKGTGGGRS